MEFVEYDDEQNPIVLYDSCPICGVEWDEIDIEYQICSYSGYQNNINTKEE